MKILFCGICRNVAGKVKPVLESIKKYQNDYDIDVFLYENDSDDNTLQEIIDVNLSKLTLIHDRRDLSYSNLIGQGNDPRHLNRCKIIADCRNVYMDYIEENKNKYQYVGVVDLDLLGGLGSQSLNHAIAILEEKHKTGSVSGYGALADFNNTKNLLSVPQSYWMMYDSFAYRDKEYNITQGTQASYNNIQYWKLPLMFPVLSNFNGFALYRSEAIAGLRYRVEDPGLPYIVNTEHVVLHKEMKENGWDIMMSPAIMTYYSRL